MESIKDFSENNEDIIYIMKGVVRIKDSKYIDIVMGVLRIVMEIK